MNESVKRIDNPSAWSRNNLFKGNNPESRKCLLKYLKLLDLSIEKEPNIKI